jgi:outer membrane protein assembly factor BamB
LSRALQSRRLLRVLLLGGLVLSVLAHIGCRRQENKPRIQAPRPPPPVGPRPPISTLTQKWRTRWFLGSQFLGFKNVPKLAFTADELIGIGTSDVVAMSLDAGTLRPISSTLLMLPAQAAFDAAPFLLDTKDRKLIAFDPKTRTPLWEELCPFAESCLAQDHATYADGLVVFLTLRQVSAGTPFSEWFPHDDIVGTGRAELVAADAATGAIRWRAPLATNPELITKLAITGSHVMLATPGGVESFDAATGKAEWKFDPAVGHPGRFIISAAPDLALTAVEVTGPNNGGIDAEVEPSRELVYLDTETGSPDPTIEPVGFIRYRRGNHILMGSVSWFSDYPVTCLDTVKEDVVWHRDPGWLPYCIDDDAVYGLQMESLDEAPYMRAPRIEAWSLKDGMTEWSVEGDFVAMHCLVGPRGDAQIAAVSRSGEVSFYRRGDSK